MLRRYCLHNVVIIYSHNPWFTQLPGEPQIVSTMQMGKLSNGETPCCKGYKPTSYHLIFNYGGNTLETCLDVQPSY